MREVSKIKPATFVLTNKWDPSLPFTGSRLETPFVSNWFLELTYTRPIAWGPRWIRRQNHTNENRTREALLGG